MEINPWEESYRHGNTMWDIGRPSAHLLNNMKLFNIEKSLDICSGPGNDIIFLARHGSATGIDISITSIRNAKKKSGKDRVRINFVLGDFLELPFKDSTFTFVNDRGCFHHVSPMERKRFSEGLARVMKKEGRYLMQGFCRKEKRILGPHKLSEKEIRKAFEEFKIVSLSEESMDGTEGKRNAYVLIAEKK